MTAEGNPRSGLAWLFACHHSLEALWGKLKGLMARAAVSGRKTPTGEARTLRGVPRRGS